jgi:molybdopterin-binding protein
MVLGSGGEFVSYVIYTKRVAIQERQRTPLGRVSAWLCGRAAGTLLKGVVSQVVYGSLLTRVAVALSIGVCLGAFLNFTLVRTLPSYGGIAAVVVVAAVAGMAAGGAGGFIVGLFWGWLLATMADSLTKEFMSNAIPSAAPKIVSWLLSCLAGWCVGLLIRRWYVRHVHPRRGFARTVRWLGGVLALSAIAVVLWRFAGVVLEYIHRIAK